MTGKMPMDKGGEKMMRFSKPKVLFNVLRAAIASLAIVASFDFIFSLINCKIATARAIQAYEKQSVKEIKRQIYKNNKRAKKLLTGIESWLIANNGVFSRLQKCQIQETLDLLIKNYQASRAKAKILINKKRPLLFDAQLKVYDLDFCNFKLYQILNHLIVIRCSFLLLLLGEDVNYEKAVNEFVVFIKTTTRKIKRKGKGNNFNTIDIDCQPNQPKFGFFYVCFIENNMIVFNYDCFRD